MLSVNAIDEDGRVTLLEEIPGIKQARVIVTVLDEYQPTDQALDSSLFDDLVGAVAVRDDGSIRHDDYQTISAG